MNVILVMVLMFIQIFVDQSNSHPHNIRSSFHIYIFVYLFQFCISFILFIYLKFFFSFHSSFFASLRTQLQENNKKNKFNHIRLPHVFSNFIIKFEYFLFFFHISLLYVHLFSFLILYHIICLSNLYLSVIKWKIGLRIIFLKNFIIQTFRDEG